MHFDLLIIEMMHIFNRKTRKGIIMMINYAFINLEFEFSWPASFEDVFMNNAYICTCL